MVTPVGLVFPRRVSFQQWDEIGQTLAKIDGVLMWFIGDWWVYGENAFPNDKLATAASLTGFSYKTLYQCNYVSRNVPFSRRLEKLTWSHHLEVASLDAKEQDRWLALAEKHQLSTRALRASIRADRVLTEQELATLSPKTPAIISLAGLSLKFRLFAERNFHIEELDMPALETAERNLRPFVEAHEKVEARLKAMRHVGQG